MNQLKQQAIEKSYAEHWDEIKDHVDENGWFNAKPIFGGASNSMGSFKGIPLETMDLWHPQRCYKKRPKSLDGLENNNGWFRIDEEFPEEEGQYDVILLVNQKVKSTAFYSGSDGNKALWKELYTHYKPIPPSNMPIY